MIQKKWSQVILMTLSQFFYVNALAEDNNLVLVSLPHVIDYTEGDGWAGAIGFKVEYLTAFHGSDHYLFEVKPEVSIQWRSGNHILFWEGFDLNHTKLGWRGLAKDKWLVEAGVQHDIVIPSGRSESVNLELPHRGSEISVFFDSK